MTPRIDPIGPYERATYPVRRVERERRPADDDADGEDRRRRRFEDQLERGLRERQREPHQGVESGAADRSPHQPPPDDGLPHIDISV